MIVAGGVEPGISRDPTLDALYWQFRLIAAFPELRGAPGGVHMIPMLKLAVFCIIMQQQKEPIGLYRNYDYSIKY